MNVKITLSVPIEEVEQEVHKMLLECKKRSESLVEDIDDILLSHGNPVSQVAQMEQLRKKLAVVDLKLEDSYSVLKGYVRYKMGKESEIATNDPHQEGQSDQNTTR